jgi:hypothetical protein
MKLKILSLSAAVIFARTLSFSVDTTSASPKSPAAGDVPLAAPEPAAAPLLCQNRTPKFGKRSLPDEGPRTVWSTPSMISVGIECKRSGQSRNRSMSSRMV